MKTYSVKEIADLLGTNPETVRRWIRNGKLKAIQESRKDGNSISEAELNAFLKKTPKYASIAANSLLITVPTVAIPLAIGGLIGTAVADRINSEEIVKNAKISPRSIVTYLQENIALHKKSIRKKQSAINQLEDEVKDEQTQIEKLSQLIQLVEQNSTEE